MACRDGREGYRNLAYFEMDPEGSPKTKVGLTPLILILQVVDE